MSEYSEVKVGKGWSWLVSLVELGFYELALHPQSILLILR